MENFIELIRAASASDASEEARTAGAQACRMILQVLEAKQGDPLTSAATTPQTPIGTMVSALRGMPLDQLLDVAIAKLRSALPDGKTIADVEPLKINLVTMPPITRKP